MGLGETLGTARWPCSSHGPRTGTQDELGQPPIYRPQPSFLTPPGHSQSSQRALTRPLTRLQLANERRPGWHRPPPLHACTHARRHTQLVFRSPRMNAEEPSPEALVPFQTTSCDKKGR